MSWTITERLYFSQSFFSSLYFSQTVFSQTVVFQTVFIKVYLVYACSNLCKFIKPELYGLVKKLLLSIIMIQWDDDDDDDDDDEDDADDDDDEADASGRVVSIRRVADATSARHSI